MKWYNDEREDDDPRKVNLHADLEAQLKRWTWLYNKICLPKNRYKTDAQLIRLLAKEYPDLSERTCRRTLRDMRRFYGSVDQPVLAFEKKMLIASIKDTLRKAKLKGDLKSASSAEKNLIAVLGADQPEQAVENKTIINVIGFNPEQLGAQALPQAKLDELIAQIMNVDKKKADQPFDDFTDVSDQ
ncbi:hypothetical protein IC229_05800 [Spirosoma sp. BT702]|uniref:Uncharacterized protein n=1 Tax=Spirosoma profusum TaxID=2771354 RepID=A0A927AMN0_9BACT|nr:hypothetical protein [Spirosoma profusum]MBD2700139.1 hypothetical protein [Spirosoma profusum]